MKIASWNINSVRIRLALIKQFVDREQPDILCLQETKTQDVHFPLDALQQMGFSHSAFIGQKSYNGVAILSRHPLTNITTERFIDKDEARHICAVLPDGTRLHNVYIPAGGDIPDPERNPKFKDKLEFVDALTRWSRNEGMHASIIVGDMNIAPLEQDVWSHKQLLKIVSHTPVEVEKMIAFQQAGGWIDTTRQFIPETEKLYSWWSYRARDWEKSDRGRRLDHIWISEALRPRLCSGAVLREARGWANPSDHVPVMAELKNTA